MSCVLCKLAFALRALDRLRIGTQLVGCDRVWRSAAHYPQSLAEEAVCSIHIAAIQQDKVDELTLFVYSPKQILPLPSDLDVSFIHLLGAPISRLDTSEAASLTQERSVGLNEKPLTHRSLP